MVACALLLWGSACGGETEDTGGAGGSSGATGASTAEATTGTSTAETTTGTTGPGSSCESKLAGKCACSSADVFTSSCSGSGKACAEVYGEDIEFVDSAGSSDCGSKGTWTPDGTCPTEGRLGGCKDTIGSTAGCPIERTSWYYADPDAGIATKEDVQALCAEYDGEFVEP